MTVLVLLVVFVFKFAWLLAALAAAAVVGRSGGKWLAWRDDRAEVKWQRDAALCARADRQNRLAVAGDPRRVYGDYMPAGLA